MPAHSEKFPWPSYYGNFDFFERRMNAHSRVRAMHACGDGLYQISRVSGDIINVFICECYSFGIAEYIETTKNFGRIDAVIINSNWCGYTDDVKLFCRDERVGVFTVRGFMAALNRADFWMYLDDEERERFQERGLI